MITSKVYFQQFHYTTRPWWFEVRQDGRLTEWGQTSTEETAEMARKFYHEAQDGRLEP